MDRRACFVSLLVLAAVVAPRPAAAGPEPVRWDLALGFAGGAEAIGEETYRQAVGQLQLGRWVTPEVGVTATVELGAAHAREVVGGVHRGYLGVRHRMLRAGGDFTPEVIVAAATGVEAIAWDRGRLARWASTLGVEARVGFEVPDGGSVGPLRAVAFRVGVQVQAAPAFERAEVAVRCTACTPAPAGRGVPELGIVGYVGLAFGR